MTIKFKATKHFFFLLAPLMLIGAGIIVCILLYLEDYYRPGPRTITLLGIPIGIGIYFVLIYLIKKFSAKDYCMELTSSGIAITSAKYDENIRYNDVQKFLIWNNGDNAKIIIESSTKKYKYLIGYANLKYETIYTTTKNDFCILRSFSETDSIFKKKRL